MSTDITSKLWLLQNERAIECLVKRPTYALKIVGSMYRINPEDLQTWLDKYNGGARELTAARVHEIKVQLGILSSGRAAAQAEPVSSHEAAPAKDSAPNKASFEADTGKDPWRARPRRPRTAAVKKWRSRLEQIISGNAAGLKGPPAWRQALMNWFGTAHPAPAMVGRFLAWYDSPETAMLGPVKAKEPKARKPRAAAAPQRTAVRTKAAAGEWQELEIRCGRRADYQLRYGGTNKNPCLTFPKAAVEMLKPLKEGGRVRVWWNSDRREVKLGLNGEVGLKLRTEHGGMRATSLSLRSLMGAEAMTFRLLSPIPKDDGYAELVFGEVGAAQGGES